MRASCSARYLWRQGVGLVPIKARKATEQVLTGGQAHSRIGEAGEVGRRSDRGHGDEAGPRECHTGHDIWTRSSLHEVSLLVVARSRRAGTEGGDERVVNPLRVVRYQPESLAGRRDS
jgi:hypothetical protein